jgi:multidrug efflux pump subunit AcrA (membrane-fusion protein)
MIPLRGGIAGIATLFGLTFAVSTGLTVSVLAPGYKHPANRTYTSGFGYPSLLRATGRPFPVQTATPERRTLTFSVVGEGVVRSEPVLVPVVPVGRIGRVLVEDGDAVHKGQLLAEIDPSRARINVEAARLAIATAKSELGRIRSGSTTNGRYERPKLEEVLLDIAQKEERIRQLMAGMEERLQDKYYQSRWALYSAQINQLAAQSQVRQEEVNLAMAREGLARSVEIGENAIREAELVLELRRQEADEYKVVAPVDGVIERRLIHEGEYNPSMGKPGFLIATGGWFEAQFDQATLGRFAVGERVEVRLEARPNEVLIGRVARIIPFVSYNLGGPETDRPVRPTGTGAPEWPATYAVRVALDGPGAGIVPGLTGFVRIRREVQSLAIPRTAVSAISAGKGIVLVADGSRFEPKDVTLGVADGDWIGVESGIGPRDKVIVEGQHALMPGDRIEATREGRNQEP